MKFYFQLQISRLKRHIKDAGINPALAYLILTILFILISNQVFSKLEYAEYIYSIIGLALVNSNGEVKRNQFIKTSFTTTIFNKIRIIENILYITPFIAYLLYKQHFILSLSTLLFSVLLSLFNKVNSINFVLPTPFYKRPFEFIIGFRSTFYIFIITYILAIICISVDNFNLGIFSLIATFMTCSGYFSKVEPNFYVWIHAQNPKQFLINKSKTILFYSFVITLPITILLLIFYPENWYIILIFKILGMLIIIINMLGKYAYYQAEINIIQALSIVFCILFPPLMLILIPFFYSKSVNNLKQILK